MTFAQALAGWVKKTHWELAHTLAFSSMQNAVEDYEYKATKRKIKPLTVASLVAVASVEGIDLVERLAKSIELETWALQVFDKAFGAQASYETLDIDRLTLRVEDEKLRVDMRVLGNEQEPDTEVPSFLSTSLISGVLKNFGDKGARVDWSLREIRSDYGISSALLSTYAVVGTFAIHTLMADVLGSKLLELMAEKLLSPGDPIKEQRILAGIEESRQHFRLTPRG